ncbi:MAG: DUF222 domain-containing protein [Actinomycetes bacterium]
MYVINSAIESAPSVVSAMTPESVLAYSENPMAREIRNKNRQHSLQDLQTVGTAAVVTVQSIATAVVRLSDDLPTQPASCSTEAIHALKQVDQLIAWAEAQRQVLLLAAVGTEPAMLRKVEKYGAKSVSDVRAAELAALTNVSPNACFNQVHTARTLLEQVPSIFQALLNGVITTHQNRIILDGVRELTTRFSDADCELSATTLERFCTRVLWRVERRTSSELRRIVRDAVLRLAPVPNQDLSQSALSQRRVSLDPAPHGMAYLTAYLSAHDASATWQVLNQAARSDSNLTGSQSARMADALVAIVAGMSEMTPEQRNAAAEIQVLVDYNDILEAATDASSPLIGEIASTGLMLEGSAITQLLEDARFRRIIVEPETGRLLDFGRETYRPPTHLRNAVKARDLTCRAPGCVRPARYCDLDHVEPWESGGQTNYENLAALCRTHHLLKTHGNWSYQLLPDGSTLWTLPNASTIEREPAQIALGLICRSKLV